VPPRQRILNGRGEGVAQVQRSGHVGGRDDHDELFFWGAALRRELAIAAVKTRRLPPVLPRRLDGARVVCCFVVVSNIGTRRERARIEMHSAWAGEPSTSIVRTSFLHGDGRDVLLVALGGGVGELGLGRGRLFGLFGFVRPGGRVAASLLVSRLVPLGLLLLLLSLQQANGKQAANRVSGNLRTDGRFNLARSISSRNIRQANLSLGQLLELVLGHGLVVASAISLGGGAGLLRWSSQKQAKTIERIERVHIERRSEEPRRRRTKRRRRGGGETRSEDLNH
jgi:hypothetical protein